MTHRYSRPLAIAYFVTLSFWLSAPLAIDANQAPMKLYEIPMRSMVKDKPKPNYPASAVAKNTSGVAVVMISVTSKGVVESAVVLQSPGPEFSDSVSAAVQKWVFSAVAPVGREPLPFRGKLTFYFDVENGTGRVREISDFKAGAAMLRPGALSLAPARQTQGRPRPQPRSHRRNSPNCRRAPRSSLSTSGSAMHSGGGHDQTQSTSLMTNLPLGPW